MQQNNKIIDKFYITPIDSYSQSIGIVRHVNQLHILVVASRNINSFVAKPLLTCVLTF